MKREQSESKKEFIEIKNLMTFLKEVTNGRTMSLLKGNLMIWKLKLM